MIGDACGASSGGAWALSMVLPAEDLPFPGNERGWVFGSAVPAGPQRGRGTGRLRNQPLRLASKRNQARRSEEHTSELQSLMRISYAVFCLKKTNRIPNIETTKVSMKHKHHH